MLSAWKIARQQAFRYPTFNNIKKNYLNFPALTLNFNNFDQHGLHTQVINSLSTGSYAAVLTNDISSGENKDIYIERSLDRIRSGYCKAAYFYIYVQKAAASPDGLLLPGHIVSFATSEQGTVLPDSVVSLRNGKRCGTKSLVFNLEHLKETKPRHTFVWKIKFLSIEEELNKHFLSHALPDPNTSSKNKRFLFGIPLLRIPGGLVQILQGAKQIKENLKDEEYLLCDGVVKDENTKQSKTVKSQNCVTGFYQATGVTGKNRNPSPQMAAWSYQKLILGLLERESLIDGLRFRDATIERSEDDDLSYSMPVREKPIL